MTKHNYKNKDLVQFKPENMGTSFPPEQFVFMGCIRRLPDFGLFLSLNDKRIHVLTLSSFERVKKKNIW